MQISISESVREISKRAASEGGISGLKGVRLSVTSNPSPGVYPHLDRHLFIALNSDLLAAHTSQSPSGQHSL
jgi:hypothetical protein